MTPPPASARRRPGSFDSAVLDRTVIAIPLLEQMQEELSLIQWAAEHHPEWFASFNCAIILNPAYPGGVGQAYSAAVRLLSEALLRFPADPHSRALSDLDSSGELAYAVAHISHNVRRKLLALNQDQSDPPILRVLPTLYDVVIDLNLNYQKGRDQAHQWVVGAIGRAIKAVLHNNPDDEQKVREKSRYSRQYVFARLEARVLLKLVQLDRKNARKLAASSPITSSPATPAAADRPRELARHHAIHHIWPDFRIRSCIHRSVATVKADAALSSFGANGKGITWAVMDSGIDAAHPHFQLHANIDPASDLHADFTDTPSPPPGARAALIDRYGHGTHVAGIIAGEQRSEGAGATPATMRAVTRTIESFEAGLPGRVSTEMLQLQAIRGMAPRCQLVSLKVLDEDGDGQVSSLISAISHIQELNANGRNLRIHGVNISLGHDFQAEWFACGQSPLCVEVNRLVRSGVLVVVAAGNTGYGVLSSHERTSSAGLALTINDPGNAELAITVGSTHRDMPHVYGVSYFSSKGPSGDGRLKPDLVAPGEKILSCATGKFRLERGKSDPSGTTLACDYVEESGTSMAAPHVSGVLAAFLSVRREFIGEPEKVKQIFVSTCTDLQRERTFQGAGLVDLMRAIQSV